MTLQQGLWSGPYHQSWPPNEGDWVMWSMPTFVKVGQVVSTGGISLVVHFQGHRDATVIPDGYSYWHPYPATPVPEYTLCPTAQPRHIVEAPTGPEISVRQAAAMLGTTPKDIRRMLRSGQLRGRQEAGSWVAVLAEDSLRKPQGAESPATGS